MTDKKEILDSILSLKEATEMGFQSMEAYLDARFAAQDSRFAAQDTHLDRIEREMREGFAGVNKRLDRLERHRGTRGGDRP